MVTGFPGFAEIKRTSDGEPEELQHQFRLPSDELGGDCRRRLFSVSGGR
nr:MAG TPA_asm: glucosyl-3-phosphoglycerate synthase [Caudoviricetes sp.]